MRRTLIFLWLVILTAHSAGSAQAIMSTTEGTGQKAEMRLEKREEVKAKIEENQAERQENRQERQEERQVKRMETAQNIANRVEARFKKHATRLTEWMDKVEVRITQREKAGKDVTAAKKALLAARSALTTANTLGAEAVAKLRAIEPAAWSEQKTAAREARESVRKAQVAYAQVVKEFYTVLQELKKIVVSPSKVAQ